MVKNERINVTLIGGAPWGFRLIGGGALPLTINKVGLIYGNSDFINVHSNAVMFFLCYYYLVFLVLLC